MKPWPWWAWAVAVTLAAGCGKHKPAANNPGAMPTSSESASSNGEAQVPTRGPGLPTAPAAPVVITDSGNPQATLSQLSAELRRYVLRTQTAPKNFEDFLAKAQVQAPPPPAGKKYALQGGTVVLVNR